MEKSRVPNNWYQSPSVGSCMLGSILRCANSMIVWYFIYHMAPRDKIKFVHKFVIDCYLFNWMNEYEEMLYFTFFFYKLGCTPHKGYRIFIFFLPFLFNKWVVSPIFLWINHILFWSLGNWESNTSNSSQFEVETRGIWSIEAKLYRDNNNIVTSNLTQNRYYLQWVSWVKPDMILKLRKLAIQLFNNL